MSPKEIAANVSSKLFTRVALRTEASTVVVVSRWLWKVIKSGFFGPITGVGLLYIGYIGMCSWILR